MSARGIAFVQEGNMNISENIEFIKENTDDWLFFRNRSYTAKIQRADKEREYNVPGKKGIVYNFFEDAYEPVTEDGFVITGAAGEMWCVGRSALPKYLIAEKDITFEPQQVQTVETDMIYAGIRIPEDKAFTVETDYGEKVMLQGNRPGISHGGGDWVLTAAVEENGRLRPDFSDSGRIVNGTVFDILYQPYE